MTMDNSEFQKADKTKEADDTFKNQLDDEKDGIMNIYADYEPKDIPGADFTTGVDLIPLSKELVKCENELASYGLFSGYDKENVEAKVLEMKEAFLKVVETTVHAELFSVTDEWLAKGSAMEGNMFPAILELSEDEFIEKVLGDNPQTESMDVLNEALIGLKASEKVERYLIQLADIDIMVAPKCLQLVEEKWLIQSSHPDYYNIDFRGIHDTDCLKNKSEQVTIAGVEGKVLCPLKLRDAFEESLQAMCVYDENEKTAMVCAPHGLAFQIVKIHLSDNGSVMGDFYDIAFAVSCNFWPQCAKEWKERKRTWPKKVDIEQIVEDGVHLVAKSPTPDMNDLLWRYTFAKAEGSMSELPLVHWYALRSWSLVKSFLQNFNIENKPNVITSYHVKTLFFHALERMPVDYWINGENTVKTIVSIIDDLIECFATHECTHYYLPHINLFESSGTIPSAEFFSTVAKQLKHARQTLVEDPVEYFFPGGHGIMAADGDNSNVIDSPKSVN